MTEIIELGETSIRLILKPVRNVHLTVHPPDGRVTLVAPPGTRSEVARAYAVTKLGWIRQQQLRLHEQAREAPREYLERESHMLWGRRHLLEVVESNRAQRVEVDHRRIRLTVRSGSDAAKRAELMRGWHRSLLHREIPLIINRWEPRLGVQVKAYYLQRMKTRWGSCNHHAGTIRLNTELVKKPKDLVEYVVVHEMAHLIEPTHNEAFVRLMNQHWPGWREARAELNALPL